MRTLINVLTRSVQTLPAIGAAVAVMMHSTSSLAVAGDDALENAVEKCCEETSFAAFLECVGKEMGCDGENGFAGCFTDAEIRYIIEAWQSTCNKTLPGDPGDPCGKLVAGLQNMDMPCGDKNRILQEADCAYRFDCKPVNDPPPGGPPVHPYPIPGQPTRPVLGLGVAQNPLGSPGDKPPRLLDVDLSRGSYEPVVVDISLPAKGFRWPIGRSFSAHQRDKSGGYTISNNYQGINWMQISQPLAWYRPAKASSSNDRARVSLILQSNSRLEFEQVAENSNEYRPLGEAGGGVLRIDGGGSGTTVFEYHDTNGNVATFVDTAPTSSSYRLLPFWKMKNAAGDQVYVGHATNWATALSNGYQTSAPRFDILKLYDTEGRLYEYAYSSGQIGNMHRLTSVTVYDSSSPTNWIAKVTYSYYTTDDAGKGEIGDLKLVEVDTPTSAGNSVNVRTSTYYRYYTLGTYNASSNPGFAHAIKFIVEPEGFRRFGSGIDSKSDGEIKPYAAKFFSYHDPADSYKGGYVWQSFSNGECGCSGSPNGMFTFDYAMHATIAEWTSTFAYGTNAGYSASVTQPDGTVQTHWMDIRGLPLGQATSFTIGTNTYEWPTKMMRGSDGLVEAICTPEAVTSYTAATGAMTASDSAGLVQYFEYASSVGITGLVTHTRQSEGYRSSASARYLLSSTEYELRTHLLVTSGAVSIYRPFPTYTFTYDQVTSEVAVSTDPDDPGVHRTVRTYDAFWTTSATDPLVLVPKKITTTLPKVKKTENGMGDGSTDPAVTSVVYLRKDGTPAYSRETTFTTRTNPVYTYTKFNKGQLVTRVVDVLTGETEIASGDSPSTDFGISDMLSTGGMTQKTLFTYDNQGRPDITKLYATLSTDDQRWTKNYYSKLSDGRIVVLSTPKHTTSDARYYGPASYSVMNHRGGVEFSGTLGYGASSTPPNTTTTSIGSWISTTSSDPFAAVTGSGISLSQASVTLYDFAGARVIAQHMYTVLGTTPAYDASTFEYDDMGRVIRTVDPTGTINRTVYDRLGRTIESWVGTSDTGWPSGGNMFKTQMLVYDGGAAGKNSRLTKRTLYVDGTSGTERETEYVYDYRGRTIVVKGPLSPYAVSKYDNRGRTIAVATYSDATGLTSSSDPTSTTTNRLSLSESFYDARGQNWRQVQWEIAQSGGGAGNKVEDPPSSGLYKHLETRNVFGPAGEILQSRGSDAHRYNYDRLRRRTHDWSLATQNDWQAASGSDPGYDKYSTIYTASSAETNVAGDAVLVESRVGYDSVRNRVLVTAMLSRHHDDLAISSSGTSDALDPDSDKDGTTFAAATSLYGRLHGITAMYYDVLDRPTTTAVYGTNGGAAYTYSTTEPVASASADVLVSKREYDTFGRAYRQYEPRDNPSGTRYYSQTTYDDAGRVIISKANAASSSTDSVSTWFTYAAGLRTAMWVDANGNGSFDSATDQKTTYSYTANYNSGAGPSKISVNNLLTEVIYPPQTSGQLDPDRTVVYGYNAQGQQIYMKDQEQTEFATTYDLAGRETKRTITYPGGTAFDQTIKSVTTTYGDPRGMVTQIAQWANTAATTLLDSVNYTYDNIGNLKDRTQNVVEDPTGIPITHTWTVTAAHGLIAATGTDLLRNAYVLDTLTYPESTVLTYKYSGDSGNLHKAALRTSRVLVNRSDDGLSTDSDAATYRYNGQAELVEWRTYFQTASGITERALAQSLDNINGSYRAYPNLDRFDRITESKLIRSTTTTAPATNTSIFYQAKIQGTGGASGYDYNSNITRIEDARWSGYTSTYTMDGMNRLTDTTASNQDEAFTLDRLGNFDSMTFNGVTDSRTANQANQILSRSQPQASTAPKYDRVGNLTEDDSSDPTPADPWLGYTYQWDALGRLVKITNRSSQVVAEYRYSADNHRIAWRYLQRSGNAGWYYPVYDHSWRMIALYKRNANTSAPYTDLHERFYYHNAGLAGSGDSMYIDSVIMRDDTLDTGVLTRTMLYGQNWRGDVVGTFRYDGQPFEHLRYSAYGRPINLSATDWDGDGTYEFADFDAFDDAWFASAAWTDFDMDGVLEVEDYTKFLSDWFDHGPGGRDALNASGGNGTTSNNRKGYAGYEHDEVVPHMQLARHRWYQAELGSWTNRDPIGYADSLSLYQFTRGMTIVGVDEFGTLTRAVSSCGSCSVTSNKQIASDDYRTVDDPIYTSGPTPLPCLNDPIHGKSIQSILLMMASKGCGRPNVVYATLPAGAEAKFDCCDNTITLPIGKPVDCDNFMHEMVHALDCCNGMLRCWPLVKNPPKSRCARIICSEIRAYSLMQKCCNRTYTQLVPDKVCIKNSVKRSAQGVGCAGPEFDRLFQQAYDKCLPAKPCYGPLATPPFRRLLPKPGPPGGIAPAAPPADWDNWSPGVPAIDWK